MDFKRLRLTGFKSFVEPAELHIERGLTGVVGPNGCGKSNLLEAIRWVMGENSPKSLRSGGMDDVIFAGTEIRPPRDFAEVQLSASDDDGDDLEIVRRVERGAGSAYRINGKDVRAKDVALTFADAATGAHSPALVSQGKIAQVIAAKPAERRQMLEEAAGISGLHVRRKDAEQKLRATETNLARLEDIMAGLDSQIAGLRRQAKAAERYTKVSDQIRTAEARLVFARWRDAAAAADAARKEAEAADARVADAQTRAKSAEKAQAEAAGALAEAREDLADRRDDASAHGHRMAALSDQLQAAEDRLADLDRQKARLEEDRGDAGRLTKDAAEALARLERELKEGGEALARDEERLPALRAQLGKADDAARSAELALARATADQAGVEAEWRVAEAGLAQAQDRLERIEREAKRLAEARAALSGEGDPETLLREAQDRRATAETALAEARQALDTKRASKDDLQAARDEASSAFSSARAELAGIEREWQALGRDREARERQSQGALPKALDTVRAARGYERALAAALGRDAKAMLGDAEGRDGRYWTGASKPEPVADSLASHITRCPPELVARLALVHVAEEDDGRTLAPGEWLVTKSGALRRWDGFVARGEGGAEAARLEAENRFVDLDAQVPELRTSVTVAETKQADAQSALSALQAELVAAERGVNQAVEDERSALREVDRGEALKARLATRAQELARAEDELADQRQQAERDLADAQAGKAELPDPASGRAALSAAQAQQDAARATHRAANAALASHEQALAVARERAERQKADIAGWQARSDDATRRLSDMSRRFEEIEQERAVVAAKPEGLMKQIEQGDVVRARLTEQLEAADRAVSEAGETARATDEALRAVQEALSTAREGRASAVTRAEGEDARRKEMAGVAGERFQVPPPMLPGKFEFEEDTVRSAGEESAEMDRLVASRDRLGPVNLVAKSELEEAEERHGSSIAEQEELGEAVNRLRGSIGNLNREGRERLRAAFHAVDEHFQRLFARLFDGGEAHLALIDSDDPLEAGLEIFAQPPGKRLQSLTLLSGGEQALTAIALIFALFLTNPAPICVLDEVDAPLDDANIDRFCDLLDAMTRETATRYLIVTHNAVTMSRMHRLFGVTMVEKGISRLVSVDLGGAEELIAAE